MNNINKWFMGEMKYIMIAIFTGLVITFTITFITSSYANEVSDDIAESVLRLHIRANSNDVLDQELKIKVRDAILEEFKLELTEVMSKDELIELIENNYDKIIRVAKKVIVENGYSYNVTAEVNKAYLETRKYGDVFLPAGTYDALIIEIGTGEGDNWWCVLYPPLCYVESTSVVSEKDKKILKESLTPEEYEIITKGSEIDVQFKFKIVEMFAK